MTEVPTNNPVPTNSEESLQAQIEELKAQLLQAQLQVPIATKKTDVEFLPSQTNSNKALLLEREKGAILSTECNALERNIIDHKELLPSTMREGVDAFMAKVETNCVDENGLMDQELKRNLLAFLNCKVFFDIEGVEIPDLLKSKVDKIKKQKSYHLAIKDEVTELISHLPYVTKKLREIEERKKNANIVLDEFGNAKGLGYNGDSHYINAYCTGKITLEECKKNLSPDYKEKIHRYILATAKKSGYEVSQMPTMAIHNYAKVLEYVER
jgi:hypothetical protein